MNDLNVSVYLTVKDGWSFLPGALNSVYNQTKKPEEIVIVDDGSHKVDDSVLDIYKTDFDIPIKLIKTRGVGRAVALNVAVESCSGALVSNLDVDDLWHPQKIEIQKSYMVNNPSVAVSFSSCFIFHDGEEIKQQYIEFGGVWKDLTIDSLAFNNPVCHSSVMCRRQVVVERFPYDISRSSQIDYELWLRLIRSGEVMRGLDQPLAYKRIHKGQSFEASNRICYSISAFKLSLVAASRSSRKYVFLSFAVLKLGFNFLPRWLKIWIKRNVRASKTTKV